MILKASQRADASRLGAHLLKTEENEHVEIHEVSGFVSENLLEAMREADALARGTKCTQPIFSVSLNPPAGVVVDVEVFEKALSMIEEKTGLAGQPRVVVFHEKEGRRHCHAAWSRIDAQAMTAKPLSFFKEKLNDIARQLFLEHGWEMPRGFSNRQERDPRNFTLAEWQMAKRSGVDPAGLKASAQEAWAISDNVTSFAKALEERGLFLARGDRRGYVAITLDGEVHTISRLLGGRTKDVTARLGDPSRSSQPSVNEVRRRIGSELGARLRSHITEAKRIAANALRPLAEQRDAMKLRHQSERIKLREGQAERAKAEQRVRSARIRRGIKGAWDFLTGRYSEIRRQNDAEFVASLKRDRAQAYNLVRAQMPERVELQNSNWSFTHSARKAGAEPISRRSSLQGNAAGPGSGSRLGS